MQDVVMLHTKRGGSKGFTSTFILLRPHTNTFEF
jgi:hypothetical protein